MEQTAQEAQIRPNVPEKPRRKWLRYVLIMTAAVFVVAAVYFLLFSQPGQSASQFSVQIENIKVPT